jgi:hypothetical protein
LLPKQENTMQRKSFLQHLTALGAFGLLPASSFKQYQKYYLLQCFVAGFRYYEGMRLLPHMKAGDELELVREPHNEYDACAIALHWNQHKIGFIPATENPVLSRLLDARALELTAEITHLNHEVQPWENLCIALSFLKELSHPLPAPDAAYLTCLQTPHYTSLKGSDNTLTRIVWTTPVDDNETDWYRFLEKHSAHDGIYSIIHGSDVLPHYPYGRDTGEYLLVNKHRVRQQDLLQQVLQGMDETLIEVDKLFDTQGYIVLSTQQAERLVPRLEAIANVTDKLGRHFIELVL